MEKHSKASTAACSINLSEPSVDGSGNGRKHERIVESLESTCHAAISSLIIFGRGGGSWIWVKHRPIYVTCGLW